MDPCRRSWAPQSHFCGGLAHSIANYEVIDFKRLTTQLPEALRRAGLKEPALRRVQQVLDTEWLMGGRKHTTSNGATGKRLSAAALEAVRAFYREDLELWGQAVA